MRWSSASRILYRIRWKKLIKNEPRLLIIDADLTDLDLLNPASISEFLKSVHEICLDLTVIILVNTIAEKKAVLETGEKHVFLKGVQEEQAPGSLFFDQQRPGYGGGRKNI